MLTSGVAKASTRVVAELSAWMATKVATVLAGALVTVGVAGAWMAVMMAATGLQPRCLQCVCSA